MADTEFKRIAVLKELAPELSEYTKEESFCYLDALSYFGTNYSSGCHIEGAVFLVLDNSIVQSFKHRETKRERRIIAFAFTSFCRFADLLSSRETSLAITPAAVFECMGRRCDGSLTEAKSAIFEISTMLRPTKMPLIGLSFKNAVELVEKLKDVVADEDYLSQLIAEIDGRDWRINLRAKSGGVKIPFRLAAEALPSPMPLRYFDEFYVSFVLSGRIERKIIEKSGGDPKASPIGSGELTDYFSNLNKRQKRSGKFSGFGDIDIFQTCDLARQFQENFGYVMIGQTNDRTLNKILRQRTSFVVGSQIVFGHPEQEDQITRAVEMMTSDPFREHSKRNKTIIAEFSEFFTEILDHCAEIHR